jgi:phosphoribosylglycinamide formyltransferase 1
MRPPLRLGLLVSGEGTTLEGLAGALASNSATVRIAVAVADRPGTRAIERAERRGLPVAVVLDPGSGTDAWGDRLTGVLVEYGVDVVVLAGFLSILPPTWVERWRGRAVNVHPSLLPKYGGRGMHGRRVHEAVLAAGDTETGATVHLVTGTVDGGPSIAQERIPVRVGDTTETLRDRLRPVEVELLASTVRRFADGTLPLPYPGGDAGARERRDDPARRA